MNKVEQIKPYSEADGKTEQVQAMFDSIAPAYDFMNRAMTLGIDRLWRRKAVRMLGKSQPQHILDVATGTGDLAMLLHHMLKPSQGIVGIDLSEGMLSVAKRKVAVAGFAADISFEPGDCLNLRFADGSFDAVTVAYGVRNFEHLDRGYAEMHRVLAEGGVLCVVELSTPTGWLTRRLYDLYTLHIIPFVGRLVSHDVRAYRYLPESIAAVPQGEAMLDIMRAAGFNECSYHPLTFGTCTIYLATK